MSETVMRRVTMPSERRGRELNYVLDVERAKERDARVAQLRRDDSAEAKRDRAGALRTRADRASAIGRGLLALFAVALGAAVGLPELAPLRPIVIAFVLLPAFFIARQAVWTGLAFRLETKARWQEAEAAAGGVRL